jgi:hypothetical protein
MRRTPGISLYRPPARRSSALRRYGPIAAVGGLIGVTAGLGLTLTPIGQIAKVTPATRCNCAALPAAKDRTLDRQHQAALPGCNDRSARDGKLSRETCRPG